NIAQQILPEVLLYKALAYSRMGKKEEAKQAIFEANDLSSESVYSQLGDAYLKVDSSDVKGALAVIEKILLKAPELSEALILKGQLLFIQKDYAGALVAFNKYHQLLPKDIKIRLFLANAYIKNEQFADADKHLDFLLKLIPEHALTNQLKGIVYYQKGNYKLALSHTEKAIQNGLNTPSNRVIAGLSAFKLQQYELAHQYLVTIADILPKNHPVRRVLALVQMQLGYSSAAGETLSELEGLTAEDVNLFTSASFELLKAGKIDQAKYLLDKTDSLKTNNPQDMTKIGILKLSMNDLEGMADLEKAVEIDPELAMAKMALAAAYIQNKEFDKALSLAEQWKTKHPEEVEGFNLAAKILLIQKNIVGAEKELQQALLINENNPYSLLYFSNKAIIENKPKKSIELLDKLFTITPYHLAGLTQYYRANKLLGSESVAIEKLAQSYEKNQTNIVYRLLYARALFGQKNFSQVIEVLDSLEDKSTSIPAIYWVLLGDSYLHTQQMTKALDVYSLWVKKQPQYRAAWLSKVSTQEKITDFLGALLTVEDMLKNQPNDSQFNVLRAYYQILTKQFSQAEIQLDSLTKEQKELPLVKGLQGQIWFTEGKFKQALPSLKGLYKVQANTRNTTLVFATLLKLGDKKAALTFLEKHIENYPKDDISRNLLAEYAIKFDLALAKKHYLVLLKASPNDIPIINNLAWVEYKLAEYNPADKLVQRALKLKNDHPKLLDTAGLIKLKLGNKAQAIKLLKQANLLAPKDKEIAKHYRDAIEQ
ncbi:MAG: PEP-CTERM system TPR-repeat protein PrsT, partial [Flavobacteriaceae bacterium]|nr:PEP-CTERM system TPR-repeat protein PrsT [Flavobacteriaceae bacterium]